jgi:hypothetical protein
MAADPTRPSPSTAHHPDQALQFLDLTCARHRLVAIVGHVLPRLHGQRLPADQYAVVHTDIARARAALDSLASALDACEIDADETLIRLLENR